MFQQDGAILKLRGPARSRATVISKAASFWASFFVLCRPLVYENGMSSFSSKAWGNSMRSWNFSPTLLTSSKPHAFSEGTAAWCPMAQLCVMCADRVWRHGTELRCIKSFACIAWKERSLRNLSHAMADICNDYRQANKNQPKHCANTNVSIHSSIRGHENEHKLMTILQETISIQFKIRKCEVFGTCEKT